MGRWISESLVCEKFGLEIKWGHCWHQNGATVSGHKQAQRMEKARPGLPGVTGHRETRGKSRNQCRQPPKFMKLSCFQTGKDLPHSSDYLPENPVMCLKKIRQLPKIASLPT